MAVINLYHDKVIHIDLSYNRLQSLDGLDLFSDLEELVLDNNSITDDIMFPRQTAQLRLLSLNNNKVWYGMCLYISYGLQLFDHIPIRARDTWILSSITIILTFRHFLVHLRRCKYVHPPYS